MANPPSCTMVPSGSVSCDVGPGTIVFAPSVDGVSSADERHQDRSSPPWLLPPRGLSVIVPPLEPTNGGVPGLPPLIAMLIPKEPSEFFLTVALCVRLSELCLQQPRSPGQGVSCAYAEVVRIAATAITSATIVC